LAFLDSWLAYRARQVDIPGFSVAIYKDDRIVFSKAYGLADLERDEPLTPRSLFGVASQSKLFTATAVLQLVEQGSLQLDDTASTYLSWLTGHRDARVQDITIRQLLTHGAGLIRDGLYTDFWHLRQPFPTGAALRDMVLAADLVLDPNSALKYSNLGFALLGQIVASVTGRPYTEYVTEHIVDKLELTNTFADYAPELDARLATAYGIPFEHRRPALKPRIPTDAFAPAVGIHATAEDMCRFASAHFLGDTRLLSDRTKREAQRAHRTGTGYDDGWQFGMGFEIQHIGERRVVGHGGQLAGYLTATYFDPKDKLAVAVLANCKDAPSTQIVRGIFEALDWFGQYASHPAEKQLERLNTRVCSGVALVEVVAAAERIVLIDPDDWEPFTFCETCEQITPTTLRITTPGSVMNEGESLHYTFAQDTLQSVQYAGLNLVPEAAYRARLKNNT
jgi:CubicO group peptidase (beta-lactamase class C family)